MIIYLKFLIVIEKMIIKFYAKTTLKLNGKIFTLKCFKTPDYELIANITKLADESERKYNYHVDKLRCLCIEYHSYKKVGNNDWFSKEK